MSKVTTILKEAKLIPGPLGTETQMYTDTELLAQVIVQLAQRIVLLEQMTLPIEE